MFILSRYALVVAETRDITTIRDGRVVVTTIKASSPFGPSYYATTVSLLPAGGGPLMLSQDEHTGPNRRIDARVMHAAQVIAWEMMPEDQFRLWIDTARRAEFEEASRRG